MRSDHLYLEIRVGIILNTYRDFHHLNENLKLRWIWVGCAHMPIKKKTLRLRDIHKQINTNTLTDTNTKIFSHTEWIQHTLASVTLNSLRMYWGMLYSAIGSTTKYWYLAERSAGQYWWHFSCKRKKEDKIFYLKNVFPNTFRRKTTLFHNDCLMSKCRILLTRLSVSY